MYLRPKSNMLTAFIFTISVLNACTEQPVSCELNENIVNLASDASPIHDPSMAKENDTYYVYSSSELGSFYTSKDMKSWTSAGDLFSEIPAWLMSEIPKADHIGAPDISYYKGRYLLFYQSHNFNTCNAATGFASNQTLDPKDPNYHWLDHGEVLRSKPIIPGLNIVCGDGLSIYNAIDAQFFVDEDDKPWLVFGSTIGGIKLIALDKETLKPKSEPEFITLAQRFLLLKDPIIEAPYIMYREGFYYLFMSFNHCCLAEKTKYQIRVGRSKNVEGPYYDQNNWPLYLAGGTLIIDKDGPYIGTGHNEVFSEDGVDWLVHHAKDSRDNFKPYLNIRRLNWSKDNWPSLCQQ